MKGVSTFIKNASWLSMMVSVVAGVLFVTMVVNASTTISTSIATGGDLSVTGNSTLTGTLGVTGATTLTSATLSTTLGVTGASTLTGGASVGGGTSVTSLYYGTCNIQAPGTSIAASSTVIATCGAGFNGSTAISGITSTSKIILQQPTSTPTSLVTGLVFAGGASASTTAGFITVNITNLGPSYNWSAAASTSWQYIVIN